MNSLQIDNILKNNKFTKKYFLGVFASDKIPPIKRFPSFLVVNTAREGREGEHWQAIIVASHNQLEFFDSFGRPPTGAIKRFAERYDQLHMSSKKVQSNLEVSCGPHVIYFLIERAKGRGLKEIVSSLSRKGFGDSFVKFYAAFLIP